jgi:hypothetical protein
MSRIEGNIVLDGGCLAHLEFDKILVGLGYEVFGVDIGERPAPFFGFYFVQRPVWNTEYKNGTPIDTILCNSLFEHLGLPCYGQPLRPDADFETAAEFHRILNPGGCLLMQVPFGKTSRIIEHKGEPFYRIYDSARLCELLKGLYTVEDVDYFIYDRNVVEDQDTRVFDSRLWVQVNENVASRIDYKEGLPPCLVYVKARKV